MHDHTLLSEPAESPSPSVVFEKWGRCQLICFDAALVAPAVRAILPRFLLGGSHRLHRNGISVGCARNFGLLPSQLI